MSAVSERLSEVQELAHNILNRLEAGEPASSVALSARRLAELQGDVVHSTWLDLEITGIEPGKKPMEGWAVEQREGIELFLRLRAVAIPDSLDQFWDYYKRGRPLPRTKGHYGSLAILEGMQKPDLTFAGADREAANELTKAGVAYLEAQRVLVAVRSEMHSWVSTTQTAVRTLRSQITTFGDDAPIVFAAGGELLRELANALESLQRPVMAATAAIQARTALLTLGRELYKGGPTHVSPVDGTSHEVKGEKNMLLAFLDTLWVNASGDRKELLQNAKNAVEEGYDLGSKAKNPFAITHAEAELAVKDAYAVAHAICFAGGFPLRGSA